MPKKKKYFPNNWQRYKDCPDDFFSLGGNVFHTFEDFMDWKVGGWDLPSSVCCIIRVQDGKTKKVSEHVYSKPSAAVKFINKLMEEEKEFTICDDDQVQLMLPSND